MKKKWIISAGVALALGALATVAVAERGGKMREQHTMRMLNHLDLSEEQQEQLQALREEQRAARREQHEAMAAMNEEHREALMNILTDEQREAIKEMRGKRGKFFGRHGWEGKGRHDMRRGGQGAFSRLGLTAEQQEQLKELRQKHRTAMRETRQKHRTALEGVLTAEQREKLEMLKDEAFYGGKRWHGKR